MGKIFKITLVNTLILFPARGSDAAISENAWDTGRETSGKRDNKSKDRTVDLDTFTHFRSRTCGRYLLELE